MIYLLLPAYNEEKSFVNLFRKVDEYFTKELKEPYQIIVCNDGSSDKTPEILESYKDKLPLTIITHNRNRGLGETIRDLFEYAADTANPEDIIIRMDCDDTHEPQFMTGLINKINAGCDVVIASRFEPGGGAEGLNGYRNWLSTLARWFMMIMFPIKGLKEYSSGFRAYKASTLQHAFRVFGNQFIQLKGLGFTCTLEKVVKLKIIGAKFGEAPMILRYDQKVSESKMVSSITTFGYLTLALLYHWPWGGWKGQHKNIEKLH